MKEYRRFARQALRKCKELYPKALSVLLILVLTLQSVMTDGLTVALAESISSQSGVYLLNAGVDGDVVADDPGGATSGGTTFDDPDAPDGAVPGGITPDGTTPDGAAPEGTNPGGTTPDGTTPEGTNPDGTTPDGTTPGGDEPGGDAPDGSTPGGDEPGGDAPDGSIPGGDEPGGDAPDGTAPDSVDKLVRTSPRAWEGDLDALSLDSNGFVFNYEDQGVKDAIQASINAILAEAQAAVDQANAATVEGPAEGSDPSAADTDAVALLSVEGSEGVEGTEGTEDATDGTATGTVEPQRVDPALPESLPATLNLRFSLDPTKSAEAISASNPTDGSVGTLASVVPGDTISVALPTGFSAPAGAGEVDVFQLDESGNPTTVKIGTAVIQSGVIKVTFQQPTDTVANAEGTYLTYTVGEKNASDVTPNLATLSATVDLAVLVSSSLVGADATTVTWTLQTAGANASAGVEGLLSAVSLLSGGVSQSVELSVPSKADVLASYGFTKLPTLPTGASDAADALAPSDSTRATTKITASDFTGSATLTTQWVDNNDTTNRPSTEVFTSNLKLQYQIDDGAKTDFPTAITDDGVPALGLTKDQAQTILSAFTTTQSGLTYTSQATGLPTTITVTDSTDPNNPTTATKTVTWSIDFGTNATAYSEHYYHTVGKDGTHYMQLLRKVSFDFVGKLGNDKFITAFKSYDSNNEPLFKFSVIGNNSNLLFSMSGPDFLTKYQTEEGLVEYSQDDDTNTASITGKLPVYNLDGSVLSYKFEYQGPQEGADYYQVTYSNSDSTNHGSDTTALWSGGTLTLIHAGVTHFTGTKVWAGDKPEDRPQPMTFTLWRYSTQAIGGGDPYAKASQVIDDDTGEYITATASDYDTEIDLKALFSAFDLPKYDPEGYPYIYAVKESVPDGYTQIFGSVDEDGVVGSDTAPNYYNVDGSETRSPLPDTWQRDAADQLLYNGGTLTNYKSDVVTVKQVKTWKIDAFQDQIKDNVEVEFTLYQSPDSGATWTEAKDRTTGNEITQTMRGFKSESLTQEITRVCPKYDPDGNELSYRWVETNVMQGEESADFTPKEDDSGNIVTDGELGTFSLSVLDADGNTTTLNFTSTREVDGTIVNTFDNTTDERAVKLWEKRGADDKPSGEFVDYNTSGDTATVSLYRDGVYVGSYTMDGSKDAGPSDLLSSDKLVDDFANFGEATYIESASFVMDFKGLPLYSPEGRKYTYLVVERAVGGWTSTRTYDAETRTTTIYNRLPVGEGGSILYLSKEWIDDGDNAHRGTSVVQLVAKQNITDASGDVVYSAGQVVSVSGNGDDSVVGKDADGNQTEIYLMESHAWFAEVAVAASGLTIDDFEVREIALRYPEKSYPEKSTSYPVYTYSDAMADGSPVKDDNWANVGWSEGGAPRVATAEHVYEVTTKTTQMQVSDNPDDVITVGTVVNRRLGIVNLTATKTWQDGDAGPEERPHAELVLTSSAGDDVFTADTDGVVYAKLPGGNSLPVYTDPGMNDPLKVGGKSDGGPYLEDGAVVVPIDTQQKTSTYYFYGMPKYDKEDGQYWSYSISERWVGDHGDYSTSSSVGPYVVSDLHFSDSQTYEFTNARTGTKDVVFYKHWQDEYVNVDLNQRPDIYLTLYKVSMDNATPEQTSFSNYSWSETEFENQDLKHWQKITIFNLPKYDSLGDEIEYYATESMSITEPGDLDYVEAQLTNENMSPGTKEEFGSGTGKFTVNVSTGTEPSYAVHSEGTFVNQLASDLKVNGVKIWQNVPGDFQSQLELPGITIYLQRKLKNDNAGWDQPEVVALSGASSEDVISNAGVYTGPAAAYGVRTKYDHSEIVAWTTKFNSTGANQWQFTIGKLGDNTNGSTPGEGEAALPRYDEDGNLYEYRTVEAMWGLYGTTAWPEGNPDPTGNATAAVNNVFDVTHGESGSFRIINTFDSEKGNLTVRKNLSEREPGDHYPDVTFKLYRSYTLSDGTEASEYVTEHTITADVFQAADQDNPGNASATYTFEDLDIYTPAGEYYKYYVVESTLDGYTSVVQLGEAEGTSFTNEGASSTDPEGLKSPLAMNGTGTLVKADEDVDITFGNSYVPESVNLTGEKEWNDYSNAFGTRPADITITLTRKSGTGQEETVTLQSDNSANEGYLQWANKDTDTWTYTISNLEKWAPDGTCWTYTAKEDLSGIDDVYSASPISGSVSVPSTAEHAQFPKLANNLKGRLNVQKRWDPAADTYGLRPPNVTVAIQAKATPESGTGTSYGWQSASVLFEMLGVTIPTDIKLDEKELSASNNWYGSWTNLPLQVVYHGTTYTIEYRAIETKIGGVEVDNNANLSKDEGELYKSDDAGSSFGIITNSYTTSQDTNNGTTTITNTLEDVSIYGKKIWSDENNIWDTRPGSKNAWSATYKLQRTTDTSDPVVWEWVCNAGTTATSGFGANVVTVTITGASGNEAEKVFANLPKYDASGHTTKKEYTYRLVEVLPGSYECTGATEVETNDKQKLVVVPNVNAMDEDVPHTYTNVLDTVDVNGTKAWEDYETDLKPDLDDLTDADNDSMNGKQLSTSVIKLVVQRKTGSGNWTDLVDARRNNYGASWTQDDANGAWSFTITGLPKADKSGNAYSYRVRETEGSVAGFYPTYADGDPTSANETWTSPTITNNATRFTLDKRSDWKVNDTSESLNDITLTVYGTGANASMVYAVWNRDASGNETSTVWPGGTKDTTTGGTLMTDSNAGYIVGLQAGRYVIKETSEPPAGYAKAADVPITISSTGGVTSTTSGATSKDDSGVVTVTAVDPVFRAHFRLEKVLGNDDSATTPLSGVTFDLYKGEYSGTVVAENKIATGITTGTNGIWTSVGSTIDRLDASTNPKYQKLRDGLAVGKYYLVETGTTNTAHKPEGSEAVFPFEIKNNNHGDTVAVTDNASNSPSPKLLNEPFQATITLKKYDTADGNGIKGATFTLQYSETGVDGSYTSSSTYTTADDGTLSITVSKKGYYLLTETANAGYDSRGFLTATFSVDDDDHGKQYDLTTEAGRQAVNFSVVNGQGTINATGVPNTRRPGSVTLTKSSSTNSTASLKGAKFMLQKKNDTGGWSDYAGGAVFEVGNAYTLTDINNAVDDSKTQPATTTTLTVSNLLWGTYRFVETKAPDGFITPTGGAANTIEFTISATSGVVTPATVTMQNTPTQLVIKKTNAGGKPIAQAGVRFTITPESGSSFTDNSASSMTLTTNTQGVATLLAGLLRVGDTYSIEETSAPAGYRLIDGAQTFTVKNDGSIELTGTLVSGYELDTTASNDFTVTAKDDPITFTIEKKNADGTQNLDGAVFKLYGSCLDGNSTHSFTLTAEGANAPSYLTRNDVGSYTISGLLRAGGEYKLEEVSAPAGYLTASGSLSFKIDGTTGLPEVIGTAPSSYEIVNDTARLIVEDSPTSFKLKKISADLTVGDVEVPLAGAEFTIKPVNGTFSDGTSDAITLATGIDGTAALDSGKLVVGSVYEVKETKAPSGEYEIIAASVYVVPQADGKYKYYKDESCTQSGAPDGYRAPKPVESDLALVAVDAKLEIGLVKVGANNTPLADTVFSVYGTFADGTGEETRTFTTNQHGFVSLKGLLLADKTYTVTEVQAPAGYEKIEGTYSFTVDNQGKITHTGDDTVAGFSIVTTPLQGIDAIKVIDAPIEVQLKKVARKDGRELSGVRFSITGVFAGESGEKTVELSTDANGLISFNSTNDAQLVAGNTYTLKEVAAPTGDFTTILGELEFSVDEHGVISKVSGPDEYEITADGTSGVATITATDDQLEVTLVKVNGSNERLADATFTLYEGDDATTGTLVHSFKTNQYGTVVLSDIELNKTYTLVETTPPNGYEALDNLTFSVGANGTLTKQSGPDKYVLANEGTKATITATDAPIEIYLKKTTLSGTELKGAVFTVTGKFVGQDGTVVEETRTFNLTEQAATAITGVVAGENYVVRETKAPGGYYSVGEFTFKVTNEGTVEAVSGTSHEGQAGYAIDADQVTIVAKDASIPDPEPLSVTLAKVNLEGEPLTGATFTVTGSFFDGATSREFAMSDGATVTIDNLIANEVYEISEVKAPAGYELISESVSFTVSSNGRVTVVSGAADDGEPGFSLDVNGTGLVAADVLIDARIVKVDTEGNTLAAASFEIQGAFSNGAERVIVTVGSDGAAAIMGLVAGQTYTVRETKAPEGYELIEGSWTFSVAEDGTLTGAGTTDGTAAGFKLDGNAALITAVDVKTPEEPPTPPDEPSEPPTTPEEPPSTPEEPPTTPEEPGEPGKPKEPTEPTVPFLGEIANFAPVGIVVLGVACLGGAYLMRKRKERSE